MSQLWKVLKNRWETEDKMDHIEICGKLYKAHPSDRFIFTTLEMVDRCKKEQAFFTYEKIVLLRTWVRENYQHDLQVKHSGIRTVNGLRKFLKDCVAREYRIIDETIDPEWKKTLEEMKAGALEHIAKF